MPNSQFSIPAWSTLCESGIISQINNEREIFIFKLKITLFYLNTHFMLINEQIEM